MGRKKIGKNEPCSPQKAFAFVEYGTRRCLSSSDRGVALEIEEDFLRFVRFVLRGNEVRKVTINHILRASNAYSLEIEKDFVRFVLRGVEGYLRRELI